MVLYINCAIHAPGVKFGHTPGVDSLHRLTMGKKLKNLLLFNHRAHSFDTLYVAMANGPLHKLCHSCPWGQIWPRPRGLIVSIDLLWEKNSKIFFSETTGPTALIFGMWQWLMVLYINCASHAPGVKFGHAPGVDSLHRLTIGKTKKIFFSETTRPTALIYGM